MYNRISVVRYDEPSHIDIIYYANGITVKRKTLMKMGATGYSTIDIYDNGGWKRVQYIYDNV